MKSKLMNKKLNHQQRFHLTERRESNKKDKAFRDNQTVDKDQYLLIELL